MTGMNAVSFFVNKKHLHDLIKMVHGAKVDVERIFSLTQNQHEPCLVAKVYNGGLYDLRFYETKSESEYLHVCGYYNINEYDIFISRLRMLCSTISFKTRVVDKPFKLTEFYLNETVEDFRMPRRDNSTKFEAFDGQEKQIATLKGEIEELRQVVRSKNNALIAADIRAVDAESRFKVSFRKALALTEQVHELEGLIKVNNEGAHRAIGEYRYYYFWKGSPRYDERLAKLTCTRCFGSSVRLTGTATNITGHCESCGSDKVAIGVRG